MRILHVAESVKGGCGTYLNQIVAAQIADPAVSAVRAILPDAHAVQVPQIPAEALCLFAYQDRSPQSLLALARAILREVREFRPDCVHLHSTFAGVIGRMLLGNLAGRPKIVYCAHGWAFDMDQGGLKKRLFGLVERVLALRCDRIVAISEYERQRGIDVGIAARKITTVLNGLADAPGSPDWQPHGEGRKRVLFIGRLDRQKGVDVLFDAVAGLEQALELRVLGEAVVGDQPLDVAGLPHVALLGWADQTRARMELAWADLVVVPSRWEGFGLVAVEAMRAGRAVVASAVGGLPEVVADGRTGVLIAPGDPVALRNAILGLDQADLAAMGKAGRERFLQCFTIDRTASGLVGVYRSVMAGQSPTA